MNEHFERHRRGRRGRPPGPQDPPTPRGRRRRVRDEDDRPGPGRMRRGDVRTALLIALLDGPGHGYELIQALESKTEGRWRPSPGSVYPSLQLLADEGLVTASDRDGKRVFELTEAGRAEANERVAAEGYPWDAMDRGRAQHAGLRRAVHGLHAAARQVTLSGSPTAIERATAIVEQARKDLYRLLAE